MKIIILGAGQVGGSLAEHLAGEQNDITVVDTDTKRLQELQDRLDIKGIAGMGSHPNVLRDAGAEDADMLIAVTNSDEVNMVGCQIAHTLFKTPRKIGRVRSSAYLSKSDSMKMHKLFTNESIPIDVLISPEQEVTHYITRLLNFPGSLQVLDFAKGYVQLVAVRAAEGNPLVGHPLQLMEEHMPNVDAAVVAIYRQGESVTPSPDCVVQANDEVFFMATPSNIRKVMAEMRKAEDRYKRIVMVGGGNIGYRLARSLEKEYRTTLIEYNSARCEFLSEQLNKTWVINGSATDPALLEEEHIDTADVFIALTNDDETNIMSSMLAKKLGVRKVMTLINKPAYVDLVQGGEIDVAISPQQITIGSLLAHVRKGDVAAVHALRRGAAEAIEAVARGDENISKVVGREVRNLPLPEGAKVAAVVRGIESKDLDKNAKVQVIMATPDLVIESNDHVIVFVENKKLITVIEQLFQVGLGFI